MDPNATIQLAIDAADQGDREAFVEAMADYKTWVARGGFAADADLMSQVASIATDRILVETMIHLQTHGLPPTPEMIMVVTADMVIQLGQDIQGRMAVLDDPIPDTVEELT